MCELTPQTYHHTEFLLLYFSSILLYGTLYIAFISTQHQHVFAFVCAITITISFHFESEQFMCVPVLVLVPVPTCVIQMVNNKKRTFLLRAV